MVNEITSSNSHAVMTAEVIDLRKHLRMVIAECKRIMPLLSSWDRRSMLEVLIEAEKKLL